MDILNSKNMYKTRFFSSILVMIFAVGCSTKTVTDTDKANESKERRDYIVNGHLSSIGYDDFEGYFPKEGLVPSAKIAFQIAEPVLKNIYGDSNIENEKPFSVNLQNGVWIIEGYLDEGWMGGVAYMEIRKSNGEILKVIHTK
jgi:NADH dehydrogenase FAD-containing subunit